MVTRDEFGENFGPIQIEAICRVMVDEFNRLRKKLGMSEISYQTALNEAMNHLSSLEFYDWMKNGQ